MRRGAEFNPDCIRSSGHVGRPPVWWSIDVSAIERMQSMHVIFYYMLRTDRAETACNSPGAIVQRRQNRP